MTVSNTQTRVSYLGDAVTTIYPIPYIFIKSTDVDVYADGVLLAAGYTITGGAGLGGSVVFAVAPALNVEIVIVRDTDLLQETDIPPNDPFPADTVERMSDKLTLIAQEQATDLGGALKLPPYATIPTFELPYPLTPLYYWRNTADGLGVEYVDLASGSDATALAAALAAPSGATLVGFGAGTVSDVLSGAQPLQNPNAATPPQFDNDTSLATTAFVQRATGGVVGESRNARMVVPVASASATFTADEVVVSPALGGARYCVPSVSQSINLATTGAGGMDTGTAPVSGYVALYLIWNPTTSTRALLATNATAAIAPEVYGGANMPSGFTASALVSVWPTNASSQFKAGGQIGRGLSFFDVAVATTASPPTVSTALNIAGAAPRNATRVAGFAGMAFSASTASSIALWPHSDGSRGRILLAFFFSSSSPSYGYYSLPLYSPQTIYWAVSPVTNLVSAEIYVTGYEF